MKQNPARFSRLSKTHFSRPVKPMTSERPRPALTATTIIVIRDAIEADVPAIVDIYNAAIATRIATAQLEPVTVKEQRKGLSEHSPDRYPFWVAETDGRVIGWLSFKRFLARCGYRGAAEISVYVNENFRRQGVARRLLEEAVIHAPSLGITAAVGL